MDNCNYHSKSCFCQLGQFSAAPKPGSPKACTCKKAEMSGRYSWSAGQPSSSKQKLRIWSNAFVEPLSVVRGGEIVVVEKPWKNSNRLFKFSTSCNPFQFKFNFLFSGIRLRGCKSHFLIIYGVGGEAPADGGY